ncbi:zinc finger protein 804A [Oncorhynchus mykiss]|uniref:zinc finger protein 804A n=1 Tax=Oncorhynchus mykiss TaxID=8022 RepID=UPI001877D951|nr:zinc finger protein 804A [Oncorhynchus mykiss]
MACYYIVISSTHLSNGHFRNIKGVFRGPLSKNGNKNLDYAEKERTTTMAKALEDPKANFYCDLCDKQYYKHQEFDNHINSYDHAHKQRLKELKQREFARNVASKTRKDERKQERALQRLHELAEQRREVQCAPGSGPKFKSTTVAVDASCRESRTDGLSGESHNSTVLETGTHNHTTGTSTGLASNSKTQQTSYWPYNGKAMKQTYKRHKIAFSFSFPKKALVKLDSAAAVFCENTEEGSKERTGTRKLRIPLVELNVPVSTTAEEKGRGFAGVEINGTKPGDLSPDGVSEGSQKSSDTLSRSDIPMPPQASHLYSVLVNSEDIARHYVSSVSQLPASLCHIPLDDPDTVLDTQNSEETQRNGSTEAEPETSKQQQVHKVERSVSGEENLSISSSDGPPENVSSSSSQSSERPGTAREKGEDSTVVVKTLSGPFTKPSQPFFSVLSKDGYTVLQWPSEMLTFTRTEPRLSYSCNPLHFDFKASQQSRANVRTGDSQSKTEPRISEALCIGSTSVCSEELIDNKRHNKEAYHIPIRDDRETVERKDCLICDHHMSDIDTESCSLQLKRHGRVYSSGKSSSQSKDQTGKRAAGIKKWKSRDRRHYRSHKKKKRRRRRRRRGGYEEERHRETETDGGVESDAEKCNKFQRQSECREGLDSQFRGTTSQPLEKSKQSAQNQADSGHTAPSATEDRERERVKREEREEREKERSRQETAGSVNGSAGSLSLCDEGATDSEKVFGSDGRRDPVDPSTEQRNAAGHGSQSHDKPCTENPAGAVRQNRTMAMTHLPPQSPGTITQKPSMTKSLSPESCGKDCCIGQSLRRKRTASSLLDAVEQGPDHQVPCTKCQSPVMLEPNGPDGSMVEGGSSWSVCVSCGGAGRQRKRQRGDSYAPHISDPPVGHNVHISDLPVGHNVHISDLPVGHNVHISDLPVGHNVHISDLPVGHNVHISDLPVGHNVHISDLPVGHNVHISDLPVGHNVHISDLPVGHNVHMAEPPVDVKSDDRCKMNIQNLMNTDVEYSVIKGPLASCSALSQPAIEHSSKPMGGSPRLQIQNSVPSIKEDSSSSLPGPVQDPPNHPEIISITNENKNITICLQNSPNVSLPIMVHNLEMGNNGEDCITRQTVTVAAHVSPLGAREITPSIITPQRFQIQNTGPDKSCQHSFQSYPNRQRCHSPQPPQGHTQHQRCYPGIRVNDETGIREGLRPGGLNITGSLCSPYHRPASPYHNHRPPSFHPQHPSDGMEKHHCVIQIQTHRHILHHHRQHQVFPGKMKPVLPGSPVPMSPSCPPMLHPVHLSPVPNGSITIQHTILHHQHHHAYHHAAFLPPHPQPPLFPQVLPVPVSRRPMGADMCPPGPSPFLTSTPHLSVVAPPSLHHHPMAVTFHAMPRPTMFPPSMLQSHPHPTVIPLQPMF